MNHSPSAGARFCRARPTPAPRPFLRTATCLSLAAGILAAPLSAGIPARDGWPAQPVIDLHTHVFNARDLPLTGILNAKGAPRAVAVVVAELFLASMDEEGAKANLANLDRRITHPEIRNVDDTQRNILRDYVGADRLAPLAGAAAILGVSPDAALLAETIAKVGFPEDHGLPTGQQLQRLTEPQLLAAGLAGYLRFIGIMLRQHQEIVAVLRDSYKETDLFVHHMMDMAVPYDDRPVVSFADQVPLMQKLDEDHPGMLLHFVAFDPFRRASPAFVERAVNQHAALGLKIYPPSGYRAADNASYGFPPRPSLLNVWERQRWNARYKGWSEKDLDDILQQAFAWAAKNHRPLFTHCTPEGFEAVPGYGLMADPFFWAKMLAKPENAGVRLCFGHAGGEDYWFSDPEADDQRTGQPPGDRWQFGHQVVELCLTYRNVYCEVAYLDAIFDDKKFDVLVRRLEAVINKESHDKTWRLGDKLIFGTDWHMIYKEKDYKEYVKRWDTAMTRVAKGAWRGAFFAGNAKAFLKLDELAQDPRFTKDQQQVLARLSASIK